MHSLLVLRAVRRQRCETYTILVIFERYVSTKLEVSMAFLFEKIGGMGRMDIQADRVQCLQRPLRKGRIIILHSAIHYF